MITPYHSDDHTGSACLNLACEGLTTGRADVAIILEAIITPSLYGRKDIAQMI